MNIELFAKIDTLIDESRSELAELTKKFVESTPARPQLFYLWGHSYEFDDDNNWNVIEDFAKYTGGRDDTWYATNIEIYEYIDDYNRLVFSADGQTVYNPTLRTLYFNNEAKTECVRSIAPGETLKLD